MHGSGKRCFDCHASSVAGDVAPELATASRQVAAHTYRVVRSGHLQFVPAAAAADCGSCHGDLASLAPKTEGKEHAFLHGSHVEELWPATDARKRELRRSAAARATPRSPRRATSASARRSRSAMRAARATSRRRARRTRR